MEEDSLLLNKDKNICLICLDEKKLIILKPCLHQCICNECSNKLASYSNTCPICRCEIILEKNRICCSKNCCSMNTFNNIICILLFLGIMIFSTVIILKRFHDEW